VLVNGTDHLSGSDDLRETFGETEEVPQALVLDTQPLDLARGLIEPALEIAIGHVPPDPRTLRSSLADAQRDAGGQERCRSLPNSRREK